MTRCPVLPAMSRRPRSFLLPLVGAVALAALLPDPAGAQAAPPPPGPDPVEAAAEYLRGTQQPDGGFDVLGAYFEHPDVVLALAEAAQPDDGPWDAAAALAAVEALETGSGETPLTYLDDLVDESPDDLEGEPDLTAGQAARLIVQVLAPLGLDPEAFDPDGDGGRTDLVAELDAGAQPDGSFGFFNATLYAVLAHPLLGRPVPQPTVDLVRSAQRVDGSWNYLGDGDPEVAGDADTTSLAVQALVAAGAPADDPALLRGLRFLARLVDRDGSVDGFSEVNSTAVTDLAVTAAGWDADEPCWRQRLRPRSVGRPFTGTTGYLLSQVRDDGGIADDPDGSVAFATAQAVQALSARWLPVTRLEPQCASSAQFADELYGDLFRRVPSDLATGPAVAALRSGASRTGVARFVLAGADQQRLAVRRLFTTYVGRRPTSEEAAPYRALLAAGVRSEVVRALVLGSDAYVAASGGGEDFVRALYRDVLGRRADDAGVEYLLGQLEAGAPPAFAAAALLQSPEGQRFTVRSVYGETRVDPFPELLDRRPTAEERRVAVAGLRAGAGAEDLLALIAGSLDYDLEARS